MFLETLLVDIMISDIMLEKKNFKREKGGLNGYWECPSSARRHSVAFLWFPCHRTRHIIKRIARDLRRFRALVSKLPTMIQNYCRHSTKKFYKS